MPKKKHDIYHQRKRQWMLIKRRFSFKCSICEKRIYPKTTVKISDYDGPQEKILYGLKLGHIRHEHTNYDQQLKQLQIKKENTLKQLEEEKAKIVQQFRLRKTKIEEEFELRRLKIKERCNNEAENLLKVINEPK